MEELLRVVQLRWPTANNEIDVRLTGGRRDEPLCCVQRNDANELLERRNILCGITGPRCVRIGTSNHIIHCST